MTIDLHAHWLPEELHNAMAEDGMKPRPFDTVEGRLEEMDKHGYTHAVLSCVDRIEGMPRDAAIKFCRVFNDATAEAVGSHPDRFSGLASLPTADVEVMLEEFERCMALPGMIGGVLPGDGFLSQQRAEHFRPLFRAANEKGAVFLVHYGRMADDPEGEIRVGNDNSRLRGGSLDMQARLSANMVTFCLTDFLAEFPNVSVLSHNLGGNIPFEIERMDHRTLLDRPGEELPSKRVRESRILVDCNSFGPRGIEMAVGLYGAEKIVCGTDGTGFGMDWTNKALDEARISDEEKDLIREGNAKRVFAATAASR